MGEVLCFLVVPSATEEVSLRRYTFKGQVATPCVTEWGHDAQVTIVESAPWSGDGDYMGSGGPPTDEHPRTDPRWPVTCTRCGTYRFGPDDEWQVNHTRHWIGPDGTLWANHKLPPGAMFYADWYWRKGPDGRCLAVALPPEGGHNIWLIDCEATGGGFWTRTGTPPNVTANPSILTHNYHGWLRDGKLVEC